MFCHNSESGSKSQGRFFWNVSPQTPKAPRSLTCQDLGGRIGVIWGQNQKILNVWGPKRLIIIFPTYFKYSRALPTPFLINFVDLRSILAKNRLWMTSTESKLRRINEFIPILCLFKSFWKSTLTTQKSAYTSQNQWISL